MRIGVWFMRYLRYDILSSRSSAFTVRHAVLHMLQVCGGNAGAMLSAIEEFNLPTTKGNWTAGMNVLVASIFDRVLRRMRCSFANSGD